MGAQEISNQNNGKFGLDSQSHASQSKGALTKEVGIKQIYIKCKQKTSYKQVQDKSDKVTQRHSSKTSMETKED